MEGCLKQLAEAVMEVCPEITSLVLKSGQITGTKAEVPGIEATRKKEETSGEVLTQIPKKEELLAKALKQLELPWNGCLARDCYSAPYLPQWEHGISISFTEDRGMVLCLAAAHGKSVLGMGIDLACSGEFDMAVKEGNYCGGSLFTVKEQILLRGKSDVEKKCLLAAVFAGKEAAFKSMGSLIRMHIPEAEAHKHRAEFRDFEMQPREREDCFLAIPCKGTKQTADFLGIHEILVFTAGSGEYAIALAVCR